MTSIILFVFGIVHVSASGYDVDSGIDGSVSYIRIPGVYRPSRQNFIGNLSLRETVHVEFDVLLNDTNQTPDWRGILRLDPLSNSRFPSYAIFLRTSPADSLS